MASNTEIPKRRGRPSKGYDRRTTVGLAEATFAAIDGLRIAKESREDFIRAAIEREIERRSKE